MENCRECGESSTYFPTARIEELAVFCRILLDTPTSMLEEDGKEKKGRVEIERL